MRTRTASIACIPAIPMAARAEPGQTILFKARNASDFDLDPASTYDDHPRVTLKSERSTRSRVRSILKGPSRATCSR